MALTERADGRALVKLLPADMLIRAREEKASAAREKAERQQMAAAAAEAKKRERLEKGKLAPGEMFRTAEYSKWDDDGVPTHDAQGQELAKARRKKLVKEQDAQKKLHAEWLQR